MVTETNIDVPGPEDGLLEKIRKAELSRVRDLFTPGMNVLEIGGGNGFQASILDSWGCNVVSIDIKERNGANAQFFPVQEYDGINIPFNDSTFDVVFSSNVLEHIRALPDFLREIRRVSKPSGTSLHILPSPAWRMWTIVTHYVYAVRWILGVQPRIPGSVEPVPVGEVARKNGYLSVLKQLSFAGAHGEYPNAIAELYFFSRRRWQDLFNANGFVVRQFIDCGVFATGHLILQRLALEKRQTIAKWLGSASFALIAAPDGK